MDFEDFKNKNYIIEINDETDIKPLIEWIIKNDKQLSSIDIISSEENLKDKLKIFKGKCIVCVISEINKQIKIDESDSSILLLYTVDDFLINENFKNFFKKLNKRYILISKSPIYSFPNEDLDDIFKMLKLEILNIIKFNIKNDIIYKWDDFCNKYLKPSKKMRKNSINLESYISSSTDSDLTTSEDEKGKKPKKRKIVNESYITSSSDSDSTNSEDEKGKKPKESTVTNESYRTSSSDSDSSSSEDEKFEKPRKRKIVNESYITSSSNSDSTNSEDEKGKKPKESTVTNESYRTSSSDSDSSSSEDEKFEKPRKRKIVNESYITSSSNSDSSSSEDEKGKKPKKTTVVNESYRTSSSDSDSTTSEDEKFEKPKKTTVVNESYRTSSSDSDSTTSEDEKFEKPKKSTFVNESYMISSSGSDSTTSEDEKGKKTKKSTVVNESYMISSSGSDSTTSEDEKGKKTKKSTVVNESYMISSSGSDSTTSEDEKGKKPKKSTFVNESYVPSSSDSDSTTSEDEKGKKTKKNTVVNESYVSLYSDSDSTTSEDEKGKKTKKSTVVNESLKLPTNSDSITSEPKKSTFSNESSVSSSSDFDSSSEDEKFEKPKKSTFVNESSLSSSSDSDSTSEDKKFEKPKKSTFVNESYITSSSNTDSSSSEDEKFEKPKKSTFVNESYITSSSNTDSSSSEDEKFEKPKKSTFVNESYIISSSNSDSTTSEDDKDEKPMKSTFVNESYITSSSNSDSSSSEDDKDEKPKKSTFVNESYIISSSNSDSTTSEDDKDEKPKKSTFINKSYITSSSNSDSSSSEDEKFEKPKKSTFVNESSLSSSSDFDSTSEDEKDEKPKKSAISNESSLSSSSDSDSTSEDEKFEKPKKSTFVNESYIISSSDSDSTSEDEKFEKPKKSTFVNESYIISSSDSDSTTSEDEKAKKAKDAHSKEILKNIKKYVCNNTSLRNEDMIELIKGIDADDFSVNVKNNDGETALILFCKTENDYYDSFINRLLLKNGIEVDSSDNKGNTALMYCCEYGRTTTTKYLIDNKADIKKKNEKNQTAFILAVMNQKQNIVDYLINLDINIYVQDSDGNTALHYACINNDVYCVKKIISNYDKSYLIKENNKNETPLTLSLNNYAIFKSLVDYGADLKFKNTKTGNNILMQSILSNKTRISEFIINQTTIIEDVLKEKNYEGKTVLNQIVENKDNVLINYIFRTLSFSWTKVKILNLSMINNQKELVSLLLQDQNQIININEKDDDGKYPLFVAIRQKNEDFVKLLIDYANTNDFNNMNINEEEGYTPLTLSYELDCKNIFEYLVKQDKINKNQIDLRENRCILYYAIEKEDESAVEKLITYNADVDLVDNEGNTPIFYAVKKNNLRIINLLKENGADLNHRNSNKESLLNITKDSKIKDHLIKIGINSDFSIPIRESINQGNFENLEELLKNNENIKLDEIDIEGDTPLIALIKRCNSTLKKEDEPKLRKLIDLMIQKGSNVNSLNKQGKSPLVYAIENENEEVIKLLIKNSVSLNQKTEDNIFPLNIAIKRNNINIVKLLVNTGANIDISESNSEHKVDPPIITAYNLSNENNNNFEIFDYLLERGANCNVKDKNGSSLLLLAIRKNNYENVQKIIEKNVEIREKDNDNNTPLLEAIKNENIDIVKLLIKYAQQNKIEMGDIDIESVISKGNYEILKVLVKSSSISIKASQLQNGNSLIKITKCKDISPKKKEKLIKALIKKGINVNSVDKKGNTSVIYAIKEKNLFILKILFENGADLSIKNNKGYSAIDYAQRSNDDEIINYLTDEGVLEKSKKDNFKENESEKSDENESNSNDSSNSDSSNSDSSNTDGSDERLVTKKNNTFNSLLDDNHSIISTTQTEENYLTNNKTPTGYLTDYSIISNFSQSFFSSSTGYSFIENNMNNRKEYSLNYEKELKDLFNPIDNNKDITVENDDSSVNSVNCNHMHVYYVVKFFHNNLSRYIKKFYTVNYFCNLLYSNFKLKPFSSEECKNFQTQNLYNYTRYKNKENENKNLKNLKFNQIKNIINAYTKNTFNEISFLLLLNEYYLCYKDIYDKLNNKIEQYRVNIFYSNKYKFMIINIVNEEYLSTLEYNEKEIEYEKNYERTIENVVLIVSEDIYKYIKNALKNEKISICQIICLSLQDEAIDFYYYFQDYINIRCIQNNEEKESDDSNEYFIYSNYGLKLPYKDFIREKFIKEMKEKEIIKRTIKQIENINHYIDVLRLMTSDMENFIRKVIYDYKSIIDNVDEKQKMYTCIIKFHDGDILGSSRVVGPLCNSKFQAKIEVNLLYFKILYHFGRIKLPILEVNLLENENSSKHASTFNCPNVFSSDGWNTSYISAPNQLIPKYQFFVTYLEIKSVKDGNTENDKSNDFTYKKGYADKEEPVELYIAFITKKPIPADAFPEGDINEYKDEHKYKFKLKSWNRWNNSDLYEDLKNQNKNRSNNKTKNYILDNSECQTYLPVNFSEEEFKKMKEFQNNTWKLLYGNISMENTKTDEMYYIVPMTKKKYKNKSDEVDINWKIIDNVNNMTAKDNTEGVITLGDWICYANNIILNEKNYHFESKSFEENYFKIKEKMEESERNKNHENCKERVTENENNKVREIINNSLKKIYLVNKYDKTICNFLSLNNDNKDMNASFTVIRKSEEESDREIIYKDFFEEKYELKDYTYKHKNLPLFMYDAHALIHSLSREEEENIEKKNLYIPEFFNIVAVPQAWIKILPLIPILVYKIKIFCFMDELRYKICLKYLTVSSLYRASMSKSSDSVVGEQHERLEMIGDSILKYFSSINILNIYFNRNEDFLIHKRNDFIKNGFLIDLIKNLKWKKYLIKQRFSVKNFKPPDKEIKQPNTKEPSNIKEKNDLKDDKSIADYYEALIGACFEDGICSKNKENIDIQTLYLKLKDDDIKESFMIERAKALEDGIKLCKFFLIRSGNLFTDHWKWEPTLEDDIVRKTHKKSVKNISKELRHKFNDTSALFTIINYSKDTYSNYDKSDCKRLKFIGEAVLDLITVIYFYCKKQDAKPKELTEYKHMAVTKSSYAKLFTKLNIFDKIDADEKIRREYKKTKHSLSKNADSMNLPKYFSEIFEVLVGAIFIDNKYNFGITNFELFRVLNKQLYGTLEKQKNQFNAINNCIELIQGILKEDKDKNKKEEENGTTKKIINQQVTFE